MLIDLWSGLYVAGFSVVAAGFAVIMQTAVVRRAAVPQSDLFRSEPEHAVFLFDGETLIDSNPHARALLSSSSVRGGDWLRLIAFLKPRFSEFEALIGSLPTAGVARRTSIDQNKSLGLLAEHVGGLTRIVLSNKVDTAAALAQTIVSEELNLLREIAAASPSVIWQVSASGEIVWANNAYLDLLLKAHDDLSVLGWPLPRLLAPDLARLTVETSIRVNLVTARNESLCFDVKKHDLTDSLLFFATPADTARRAEASLQSFIHILSKTFAQLPSGLAIFDNQRRLQMFNPALNDLTGLPVDFLSARPSLLAVLDALRERKMLPEPKDYRSWRRQLVDMEKAAASGQYEDTWNLSDGQTFRVTGRPHPNGALALMIEDISNEVLRTRRYHADQELGQSVIDEISTALAVFSSSGRLVMSNRAYATLWAHNPEDVIEGVTLRNLSQHWRSKTAPSALWSEVEDYVGTFGDRVKWNAEARLLDGRRLECSFSSLAGGATLAAFQPDESLDAEMRAKSETLRSA